MAEGARKAFLYLTIVGAVAIGILSYGVFQQGQAINSERERLVQLTQQLCKNLSRARTEGNAEVREPLQASLLEIAGLLKSASDDANTLKRRRSLREEYRKFQGLAEQVKLQGPIDCEFDTNFGMAAPGASASAGTVPNLAGGTTPSPSPHPTPSGQTVTITKFIPVPGPTITVRITVTKTVCRLPNGKKCSKPPSN